MVKVLAQHPETPIAIDANIALKGIKNPVFAFVLGFSTTKIVEAILHSDKDVRYVVIIEPNIGIFHQTVRRELVAPLVKKTNVDIVVGVPAEGLFPHLYKIMTISDGGGSRAMIAQKPEVFTDPFIYPPNPDGSLHPEARKLYDSVMEASKQVFLSMGCASDSFFRWEQFVRNKKALLTSHAIKDVFDKFKHIPSIVLGAGPSLDDFIEAYTKYDLKDRAIIVASDAALKKLLKHNIKPHIVTRCERKHTRIFSDISKEDVKGIYYAAYPWAPPEYFELFEKSIMLFRGNGVCNWSRLTPGEVNGGVSAGNAALEIAMLMGSQHTMISGIDCCFIDDKSHTEGTEVEFDIQKSKEKWSKIPGTSGEDVTSIPVWRRCLKEYEGGIFKHKGKGITIYNTSLKGAKLEGTVAMSWADVVKTLPLDKHNIWEQLATHLKPPVPHSLDEQITKTLPILKKVKVDLEKVSAAVHDALLISRREEDRMFSSIGAYQTSEEKIDAFEDTKKQLVRVFMEGARPIDEFKLNWFRHEEFSLSVMDICQLDTFTCENKVASLKNLIPIEHRRLNLYCSIYMVLFKTFEFYVDKLIDLFEKGPDQSVDYIGPSGAV